MNKVNIQNNALEALSFSEMIHVEGGVLPHIIAGVFSVIIGGFIFESINNYGNMVDALNEGYNDARNKLKR